MNARAILAVLVAAAALIAACLWTFLAPSTEGGLAGGRPTQAAEEAGAAATLVRDVARASEREGVAEPEPDAGDVLVAAAPDGAPAAPARRSDVDVVLRGTCIDAATRAPVAGARIVSRSASVATAADGTFAMPWPSRSETTYVTVQHEGYVELRVPVELREPALDAQGDDGADGAGDAPRDVSIELLLRRGWAYALEIVDSETGSPIAGATLSGEHEGWPFATADERGRLVARLLPGSSFRGSFSAPGYGRLAWSWRVVEDEAQDRGVVPLVRCATIRGRVVDRAGAALAEATVTAFQNLRGGSDFDERVSGRWGDVIVPGRLLGSSTRARTETDATGSFAVEVGPSRGPYRVHASLDGHVGTRSDELVLEDPGDAQFVELVLATAGAIEGRVTRNGVPWTGELRWQAVGADGNGQPVRVLAGRYRVQDVDPGDVRVFATSDVTKLQAAEGIATVVAGATARLDLTWDDDFATITGRVLTAAGQPSANAIVMARADGGETRHETRSGVDGAFTLEVPPNALFDVSAYDRVVRVWERGVPSGAEELVLVLAATGTLRLELVDAATGDPIATDDRRFVEWAESGASRMRQVRTRLASDGTTTLGLPIGRIDLAIDLSSLGYARRTLTSVPVTEHGETRRIALQRGVDVRLQLPQRAARELRRHAVWLLEESQRDLVRGPFEEGTGESNTRVEGVRLWVDPTVARQRVELGRRSVETLRGLAPGRYTLRVFPADVRLEPSTIALDEPGLVDVRLALKRDR